MWFWIAGLALFLCLGVGAYFVARSPAFWIGLGKQIVTLALPDILEYLKTRDTPEIEADMAKCVRMGGEWDNFNKKCRFK